MSEVQMREINIDSSELVHNKRTQKQFARFTSYSLKADQEGQDRARLDQMSSPIRLIDCDNIFGNLEENRLTPCLWVKQNAQVKK